VPDTDVLVNIPAVHFYATDSVPVAGFDARRQRLVAVKRIKKEEASSAGVHGPIQQFQNEINVLSK